MDENGMVWEFVPRADVSSSIAYFDGTRQHVGFLIYAEPGDLAEYYCDRDRLGDIDQWYHIEIYWVDQLNSFDFHLVLRNEEFGLVSTSALGTTNSYGVYQLKERLKDFVTKEMQP